MSNINESEDWCHYSDLPSPSHYMKKEYTLIQAIQIIQNYFRRELSQIEFEDGSRRRFNYTFIDDSTKHFLDMSVIEKL